MHGQKYPLSKKVGDGNAGVSGGGETGEKNATTPQTLYSARLLSRFAYLSHKRRRWPVQRSITRTWTDEELHDVTMTSRSVSRAARLGDIAR